MFSKPRTLHSQGERLLRYGREVEVLGRIYYPVKPLGDWRSQPFVGRQSCTVAAHGL